MPRYQKVDYNQIGMMVRVAVAMKGEPLLLKDVVADMSKKLSLGLDTHRVQAVLGYKIVEKVEQIGEVLKVSTWVYP
jgi:hypothetical protein